MTDQALEERLAGLRAEFGSRLVRRVESAAERWRTIENEWSTKEVYALRDELHSLAGAGGTFGFPAVSDAAREAESLVAGLIDGPPDAGRVADVSRALDQLERVSRVGR